MTEISGDTDVAYADLVFVARASERVTPEGLEEFYDLSVPASDTDVRRLIDDGVLEPGTFRPLNPLHLTTTSEHWKKIQSVKQRIAGNRR